MASILRGVYDVDTLDTRLTTPPTVPYRTVVDARSAPEPKPTAQQLAARASARPSRWRTPEYLLYYAILAFVIPYMLWVPFQVSRPSDPRFKKFEAYLSPGWIPGRRIDNTDSQYRLFRANLPYLLLLLIFHPLLRRVYHALAPSPPPSSPGSSPAHKPGAGRLARRALFDAGFALVFLSALHGFSVLKILAILGLNYRLATRLPRRYIPVATWVFNIGMLFANELADGYTFTGIARCLAAFLPGIGPTEPAPGVFAASAPERLGIWLDRRRGLIARWEILFNFTVLRLISFNMDYYWSQDKTNAVSIELDTANLSERDRVTIPPPPEAFTFRNYLAYAAYAPLYLTGPIITFNDYVSQSRHRPATIEAGRTFRYALRFALALLALELVLHFVYVGAIARGQPIWDEYAPSQLALLSYFNLHIIWLKLLIPWRLSRLWSLADGIDPPENMLRCVSDNFSALQFWRAWHRSYNRWLVRYLFVPLGGSSFASMRDAARSVLTYVLVFTFVALWHDIKLRLLVWGWMIVLFMLPEMTARALFPRRRWEARPTAYRMLKGAGAVLSVLMMMAANLVGFAFGPDGLQSIVAGIFQNWSGLTFLMASCGTVFVGIQIMFEIRQAELRKGICLQC